MATSRIRRQPKDTWVDLFCRGCRFKQGGIPLTNKVYKGLYQSGALKCRGLSQHLNSSKDTSCYRYYVGKKLIREDGSFDFSTSLIEVTLPSHKRTRYSHIQMGLTMTGNGPSTHAAIGNSDLEDQIQFNAFQPVLDRQLIHVALGPIPNNTDQTADCTEDFVQNSSLLSDDVAMMCKNCKSDKFILKRDYSDLIKTIDEFLGI